jgi:lipopolysaccharide/colanic/teichoic acid biosynthesis glycosyltransferase
LKRAFDIVSALSGLLLVSPALALAAVAVWLEDRRSPFFFGVRVARGGGDFRMVKFRTMVKDAWRTGVNSTSASDRRITRVGRWLRRAKLDELPQLWNVLVGDMSLVGPRPQVRADASLYTSEEREMLNVRPGVTDLASIVFADEGEILAGAADPDLLYNQIIRPWKSRMALLYVERRTFFGDLRIIGLTLLAAFDRERALAGVARILAVWGAEEHVVRIARRKGTLPAGPPPGAAEIVACYPGRAVSA